MKSFIALSILMLSTLSFAAVKKEKVTCYVDQQKVSEGLRTTLSDANFESRSAITKYYDSQMKQTSIGQELVLVEIEKKGDVEIQKTSGSYVTQSLSANEKVTTRKIDSTDTYQVSKQRKTLIKSEVNGEALQLFSTDSEVQVSPRLKIYTSVLKSASLETENLKAQYSCRIELL